MVKDKEAASLKVPRSETLLLTVSKDGIIKSGLPAKSRRAVDDKDDQDLGNLLDFTKVSHVTCSPEGELFCVTDGDLYRGPLLSKKDISWFTVGSIVGVWEWSQFKILSFHPNGELYGTTNEGEFYKGQPPRNKNIPWMCGQATMIGSKGWEQCEALFFDASGNLYTINNHDQLVTGKPPTTPQEYEKWLKSSKVVGNRGWLDFSRFMSFSIDGNLWGVDKLGDMYMGPVPNGGAFKEKAVKKGCGLDTYQFLTFMQDKTIKDIISFEFLPKSGRKVSESPEVIEEKIYDNRKSSCEFKLTCKSEKTVKVSSSFSREHGFPSNLRRVIIEAGTPTIDETGKTVKVDQSKTHNWSFTETNDIEEKLSPSYDVKVPPGKALLVVVSVVKVELVVPYRAKVKTTHGFETEIEGTWNGAALYKLDVKKEDYKDNKDSCILLHKQ